MRGLLAMGSILGWIVLAIFLLLMLVGAVTVLQELLARGPHQPPVFVDDDGEPPARTQ